MPHSKLTEFLEIPDRSHFINEKVRNENNERGLGRFRVFVFSRSPATCKNKISTLDVKQNYSTEIRIELQNCEAKEKTSKKQKQERNSPT